jgi:MFS family permease
MATNTLPLKAAQPAATSGYQPAFVVAWVICVVFYFMEYAVRSAPSVMLPELGHAFGLSTVGLSSLIGLYYYSYAIFAILAGAALDRWGAKVVTTAGLVLLAAGTAMFGVEATWVAGLGRFLQGAGAAFAFIAAVYLVGRGMPARVLATAIGITQCVGMLGGASGQFVVAPLIHGEMSWQQFWLYAGVVTLVIAVAMFIVTPRERSQGSGSSLLTAFTPYKKVLANPQTWLCGLCAGLLFMPTTVGDMTWGVAFLRDGWHASYGEAVNRAAMVPIGWAFGCPILGYLADRIGRRKPVIFGGALVMLLATLAIYLLPPNTFPPYVLAFVLGFGSGAAMIPYSTIKEVNPPEAKGSATGAMNFLVFVLSAFAGPAYGWWLQKLGGGAPLTTAVFDKAGLVYPAAIVLAMILALFLKETGSAAQRAR